MGRGCDGRGQEVGVRYWRNTARNRDSWQKLLKKTLAQRGQRWEDGVMEDVRKLG
jgi:hypothetical protein